MYTIEDYKWRLNPRMIRIMGIDTTRVHYLSDKEISYKNTKVVRGENLAKELGIEAI